MSEILTRQINRRINDLLADEQHRLDLEKIPFDELFAKFTSDLFGEYHFNDGEVNLDLDLDTISTNFSTETITISQFMFIILFMLSKSYYEYVVSVPTMTFLHTVFRKKTENCELKLSEILCFQLFCGRMSP